ncbi:MAG: phosphoglucosamine mutase, partial [Planctomycetes bacterium]|nr:phosphoglucosamine mutase [Planctomycetota bacterium]
AFADEKINTSDGIRVDFTEGWVHLRPSNTEPIVRLIAEAETQEAAAGLMHKVGSVAGLG